MSKTLKEDLPFALLNEQVINQSFEREHFVEQIWKSIEQYCLDREVEFDNLRNAPASIPIIIDSSHYLYFRFLETTLIFYDPFLIKPFLTYQYNNFKGNRDATNKEEFLGKLMFLGYQNIKSISPNNNLHRREKIMEWLESNNIKDLPERFSQIKADNRYKGKLTPGEITQYWMKLCKYKSKENVLEVLNEAEIKIFLHGNFWGFPNGAIEKLNVRHISQTEFRKFCKAFFDEFNIDNRSSEFIKILKDNFTIFDNTKVENLTKDFSKK